MRTQNDAATVEREMMLGEAMRHVATELRLIDILDMIAFVRLERFANVESLVNASTELYFAPGTLRFGHSAEVEMSWSNAPILCFDMIFENMGVTIYFRMFLGSKDAAVAIDYVEMSNRQGDANQNSLQIAKALREAQLPSSPQIQAA